MNRSSTPAEKSPPTSPSPSYKARLEADQPEEHPTARRDRPTTPWHQVTDALDTLHTSMADDTHAQAHITALGELIEATAQKAPTHLHAELRAASRAFARAQRSQIRAENQAAHTLRKAVRDIAHTTTGPSGSALAALLTALVWATIVAARWHEANNHAHQTEAARQTLHHLQAAAGHALAPVLDSLAARQPNEQACQILAHDVRAAIPNHADRILTDLAWPAFATVLADAEARRPPTPPAPQGSCRPARTHHRPPTRSRPDHPHPAQQPQPRP